MSRQQKCEAHQEHCSLLASSDGRTNFGKVTEYPFRKCIFAKGKKALTVFNKYDCTLPRMLQPTEDIQKYIMGN
jgi:hypothetical protein